jgi:hypothetical protein
LPTPRKQVELESVVGGLLGTAAGWAGATAISRDLEVPLATIGSFLGQRAVSRAASSPQVQRIQYRRSVRGVIQSKASLDLTNLCIRTRSDTERALVASFDSLTSANAAKPSRIDGPFNGCAAFIDYFGDLSITEHVKRLAKHGNEFTVSCPAMFVSTLAALRKLQQTLEPYDITLHIDATNLSSKEQVGSLSDQKQFDWIVAAESAVYLASHKEASKYHLVIPLFHQEDCLLGLSGDTQGSSLKVYYHEDSTAEVAVRSSIFWGNKSSRAPIQSAADIPTLVHQMEPGMLVSAWTPISTVLLSRFSDVIVVPGSIFRGYVSLFAGEKWTRISRHSGVHSFISLLTREYKYLSSSRFPIRSVLDERVTLRFDEMCGLSLPITG